MTEFPQRLSGFAAAFGARDMQCMAQYPWYRDADPELPRDLKPDMLRLKTDRLRTALSQAGSALCAARFEMLDVVGFNREISRLKNKSKALSQLLSGLMVYLWDAFGSEGVWLAVDKQGGRHHYLDLLYANFPFMSIVTLEEAAERSVYVIESRDRCMRVAFEAKCDRRHLPTALASMLSKYVREVFVGLLNDYWRRRVPDLKPTAGYYTDGKRFLADIDEARRKEDIPLTLLERCR